MGEGRRRCEDASRNSRPGRETVRVREVLKLVFEACKVCTQALHHGPAGSRPQIRTCIHSIIRTCIHPVRLAIAFFHPSLVVSLDTTLTLTLTLPTETAGQNSVVCETTQRRVDSDRNRKRGRYRFAGGRLLRPGHDARVAGIPYPGSSNRGWYEEVHNLPSIARYGIQS